MTPIDPKYVPCADSHSAMKAVLVVLILAYSFIQVHSMSEGAPAEACSTLTSSHPPYSPQNAPFPYSIDLSGFDQDGDGINSYTPGLTYTLILSGPGGSPTFRGFLIQARLVTDDTTVVGSFSLPPSGARLSSCTPTESTITHSDNTDKSSITVIWTAPSTNMGTISFAFAVVQQYNTFWADQRTAVIHDSSGVIIAIDYTPPPDAALAPNEYRAASGPLILTCQFQGASGTVTYTWDTTLGMTSDSTRRRTILPAVDSRVHTCTATDTETGVSGIASVPVNIVGIGAQLLFGDADRDGISDRFDVLPNNGLVFSLNPENHARFGVCCYSESSSDAVSEILGLDGTPINSVTTDPFDVALHSPAGVQITNDVGDEDALTTSDQGVFSCRLPDSNGGILEANFGIYRSDFNTLPSVTGLTFNPTMRSLTCTSTGSPATVVAWRRDGMDLTVDGVEYSMTQTVTDRRMANYDNVLTIRDTSDSPGVYTCSVSNVLGSSATSDPLTVIGIEIAAPLQPLTVGRMATFNCSTDLTIGSIQWLFNGEVVAGLEETSGQQFLELTFDPVNDTIQGGQYTCRVNATDGSIIESTTNVTIEVPMPAIEVSTSAEGSSTAGETYTLTCTVTELIDGLTNTPTLQWMNSDGVIVSNSRITVGNPITVGSMTTCTLTYDPLHISDGGNYTCQSTLDSPALGAAIQDSSVESVIVQFSPPTVTVASEAGILYAGTLSILTCAIVLDAAVDTSVAVIAMWTGPGGNIINNTGRLEVSDVTGSNLMYGATLTFNPLNTTDSGNYTCVATVGPNLPSAFIIMSAPGSDFEEITVEALPAPEVVITTDGMSIAGQEYTLICTVTVVENLVVQPIVEWSGGSTPSEVGTVMQDGVTSILTIAFHPLQTSDGGQYTCTASITIVTLSISDLNNAPSTNVTVQIPQPSVSVTTMQPTYNGTVFDLICTIVLDSSVNMAVTVTERWSDSDSVLTSDRMRCINITDTVLVDTLTYETVLTFDPLGNNSRDGNRYICQATVVSYPESDYILSTTGMGDYELSVAALPLPEVTFVTPIETTIIGQSYTLTCTVTVVDNLFVEPEVVWLGPNSNQLTASLGNTGSLQRVDSTSTLTISFDSLAPSDAGDYTCRACISIEKVAIQDHCDTTTVGIAFVVPGMVQNLDTERLSESEVLVSWDEPEVTDGTIVRYEVRVSRYEQRANFQSVELVALEEAAQNVTALTTQTTISELEQLTPYSVCVAADNLAGPGEQACRDFFSQQGAPIIVPQNITAIRLNGTAMRVSWVRLNLVEARGFVQSYVIMYSPTSSAPQKRQESTKEVDGGQNSTVINDLQPGVVYDVLVQAVNMEDGVTLSGPVSEPVTANLEEDSTVLFQLQLRGVGNCFSWVVLDTESKVAEIASVVAEQTEELCQCGFAAELITEGGLQCLSDSNEITFRARLHRTEQAPTEELIGYIEQLVERGETVIIQGLRLTVDSTCQPVAISSEEDPECGLGSTETSASSNSVGTIAGGAVGGILGVVFISIIVILIFIVVFRRTRNTEKGELVELQEVADTSGRRNIATTACVAYTTTTISQQQASRPGEYEIPDIIVVSNPSTTTAQQSTESGDEEYIYEHIPGDDI